MTVNMSVNHMLKFLDSISGERDQGTDWRGKIDGWNISLGLAALVLHDADTCLFMLKKSVFFKDLDTVKQSFVDELREMSYSLARIADAAEVALREAEDVQRGVAV